MIKNRILLSGDLNSKVRCLMEYAGWYEGWKVDFSIAEQYYMNHGREIMETTKYWMEKFKLFAFNI